MKNSMVIYQSKSGAIELKFDEKKETILLTQQQVGQLFNVQKAAISKHAKNIFDVGELNRKSTVSILETVQGEGERKVTRKIEYYNLDLVLSIGYRVNSAQATKFRQWATSILKKHLIQGYTINEKRLKQAQDQFVELQKTITFLAEKSAMKPLKGQETQILNLLRDYSRSFTFLEQFDKNDLTEPKGKKTRFVLTYKETQRILVQVKSELIAKKEATELFAQERKEAFHAIIGNIYQTFDGNDLYETIEAKAAHLLYFTIKDHPFSDGNKRSASFLFVYFLDKNNHLYKKTGERKINDNALTALALLVAESNPKEKEIMIKLVTNLIA